MITFPEFVANKRPVDLNAYPDDISDDTEWAYMYSDPENTGDWMIECDGQEYWLFVDNDFISVATLAEAERELYRRAILHNSWGLVSETVISGFA